MSGVRVRRQLGRSRAKNGPDPAPRRGRPAQAQEEPHPSRAARQLALAHHIERLVEAGDIPDYAEAARRLGITRARLTQIMNLLLLAPGVQQRALAGDVDGTERSLRRAAQQADWGEQAS